MLECRNHLLMYLTDMCYRLGYVDLHGRKALSDPWSIRHVGCYYGHHARNATTCIFIQPPAQFLIALDAALPRSQESFGRWDCSQIHHILLESVLKNWRWHHRDLAHRLNLFVRQIPACSAFFLTWMSIVDNFLDESPSFP